MSRQDEIEKIETLYHKWRGEQITLDESKKCSLSSYLIDNGIRSKDGFECWLDTQDIEPIDYKED